MGRRLIVVFMLAGMLAASATAAKPLPKNPLAGTYATKITGQSVANLNAIWEIVIKSNGQYVIFRGQKAVVGGYSLVKNSVIGFLDQAGSQACLGKDKAGYYGWAKAKHAGHTYLVLKAGQEPCSGRKAVLTTYPLLIVK